MSKIDLKNIDKYYGKNHVLKDLNLTIEDGEFLTLLGPSGCGKTTTLRVIAGLENPQNGIVEVDGKEIVNANEKFFTNPSKRGLNLVFQSYALWPHMTVYENVAFGLSIKKRPKEEIRHKVERALERMQIEKFAQRYPSELSGGQQQRVAIARAIVSDPALLLLDEPLSNLDAKLRLDMRSEIMRLHEELGTTIVYVTHDQVEALTLSTRVAIFFEGVLAQVAAPNDIYCNPVNLKVADFIGNPGINFVNGKAWFAKGKLVVQSDLGFLEFPQEHCTGIEAPTDEFDCVIGIRPEHLTISTQEVGIPASIYASQQAGSETLVHASVQNNRLLVKMIGLKSFKRGEKIHLSFNPDLLTVYMKSNELLLKRSVDQA